MISDSETERPDRDDGLGTSAEDTDELMRRLREAFPSQNPLADGRAYTCPICGYANLTEQPRSSGGGGSYENCPSCGFEFGYDDEDQGWTYRQWREQWVAEGMPWRGLGVPAPEAWDPKAQLDELLAHGDTSEDDVQRRG